MRFFVLFSFLLFTFGIKAQTAFDALRFSTLDVTSTARNMGVGGAIGGLGADFASLSTNPAGLGAYRFSEMVFTPAFTNINSSSVLRNDPNPSEIIQDETKFLLSSLGAVFVGKPSGSNWSTFSFAMGLNQLNSFEQDFRFAGSSVGSIVNRFQDQANAGVFSDFESNLAIDALAVYDLEGDGFYESDVELNPTANLSKDQTILRSGTTQELLFAMGGNFKEKVLFGLSIGVPFLRYVEEKTYEETDPQNEIDFYENLEYIENLTTEGAGINAKLGLMFLLTQKVRIGAAVHTPTVYSLKDIFTTDLSYTFNDGGIEQGLARSPEGEFDYSLRTPWRFIGSAGFILGKAGFITTEAEWVNQGNSSFNLTRNSDAIEDAEYEIEVNQQINDQFNNALNFKVGGELALGDFRLRGGLGLGFSPDVEVEDVNRLVSLGLGYRKNRFFADAAFRTSVREGVYSPYVLADISQEQFVTTETTDNRLLLTIGFKF